MDDEGIVGLLRGFAKGPRADRGASQGIHFTTVLFNFQVEGRRIFSAELAQELFYFIIETLYSL